MQHASDVAPVLYNVEINGVKLHVVNNKKDRIKNAHAHKQHNGICI